MPTPPRAGESQSDFMGRCIPVFIKEGRPKKQAVAICFDMWRKKHPGSAKKKSKEEIDELIKSIREDINKIKGIINKAYTIPTNIKDIPYKKKKDKK